MSLPPPSAPLPIVVLGDSHARYMRQPAVMALLGPRAVHVCEVSGATATGLRNPNSFTAAGERYRAFLAAQAPSSIVVFHLGEIDCGLLIWMRAEKYGIALEESLERSIEAYFAFVDEVAQSGFVNIVMTAATLPTISDTDQLGAVVNERRSKIRATQVERTALTDRFNARVAAEAARRGLPFADVRDAVVDPATGLVHTRLRNRAAHDHHMELSLAAVPWGRAISAAADRYDPLPAAATKTLGAKVATRLRGRGYSPTELPPTEFVDVRAGDTLVGRPIGRTPVYEILDGCTLNGAALPPHLVFVRPEHWTVRPG